MVEPTTFTMASVRAPHCFAWRRAARLSAVSPDWEITITSAFSLSISRR